MMHDHQDALLGDRASWKQQSAAFAESYCCRRYLVDAPPNVCTPSHIAEAARQVQQAASDVFELEVLEKDECSEMGLYLGVAECSLEPPKFIHLTYRSPGEACGQICFLLPHFALHFKILQCTTRCNHLGA